MEWERKSLHSGGDKYRETLKRRTNLIFFSFFSPRRCRPSSAKTAKSINLSNCQDAPSVLQCLVSWCQPIMCHLLKDPSKPSHLNPPLGAKATGNCRVELNLRTRPPISTCRASLSSLLARRLAVFSPFCFSITCDLQAGASWQLAGRRFKESPDPCRKTPACCCSCCRCSSLIGRLFYSSPVPAAVAPLCLSLSSQKIIKISFFSLFFYAVCHHVFSRCSHSSLCLSLSPSFIPFLVPVANMSTANKQTLIQQSKTQSANTIAVVISTNLLAFQSPPFCFQPLSVLSSPCCFFFTLLLLCLEPILPLFFSLPAGWLSANRARQD